MAANYDDDKQEQDVYLDPSVKQRILDALKEILKSGGYGEIYIQYKGGKATFVNHTIRGMISNRWGGDE